MQTSGKGFYREKSFDWHDRSFTVWIIKLSLHMASIWLESPKLINTPADGNGEGAVAGIE